MIIPLRHLPLACVLLFSSQVFAQTDDSDELGALREEIRLMRSEYESRIADLEARLDAAEKKDSETSSRPPVQSAPPVAPSYAAAAVAPSQSRSGANDNSFNPAIGAVFQGQAWSYSNDPGDYYIPGFPTAGEAGPAPEGLSLAETEISMSANVDDKFTAKLTLPVAVEDGEVSVELEEAWVETMTLPAGLAIRMGRIMSEIGYMNDRHFHSWDFADQPLPYQAFLGGQYIDDGLQLRWMAPTDFYLELGAEVFRGGSYPAEGKPGSMVGSTTLSMKTGGDIGFSNSWLFGLSWLDADADGRESGDADGPLLFTGNTDIYIADFVWKWAPNGNSRQQNLKFQAEYLWRVEDGDYRLPDGASGPWDNKQNGWYAQLIYQPFPRWRIGGRYDRLSGDFPGVAWQGTPLYPMGDDPSRYSLMVDWSNSEFSRLRFQYNHDQASEQTDNQFGLQYIFSIGAHGGHSF
jgi:hypothetical protein